MKKVYAVGRSDQFGNVTRVSENYYDRYCHASRLLNTMRKSMPYHRAINYTVMSVWVAVWN